MKNDAIVEKIVNLMKRAKGHDDAESQSSIALAQRLMLKHNISIEEVKQQSEKSEIKQSPSSNETRSLVAENACCKCR